MTANNVESENAKPRDHEHSRHHFWKHAHKDWRVWLVVLLMVACMLVYVFTLDLSRTPNKPNSDRVPAANAP